MSIERHDGAVVFFCDQRNLAACDGELATMEVDFGRALEVFRGARWAAYARKPGPGYIHCCPRCLVPR